mgnify:CR=1 FL=1
MDPITIGLLAGGGMGLLQGQQNEKKMYQDAMLKAELARYAPWSATAQSLSSQGAMNLPDSTSSLFQGAAMGASAGNLFNKPQMSKVDQLANKKAEQELQMLEQGSPGQIGPQGSFYPKWSNQPIIVE